MLVPASVLCGIGAVLILVPPLSGSLPAFFSVPLLAFWISAWYLDARFTAKHWQLVLEGREANVLMLVLARISPSKQSVVFAAHSAFSVGAAAGLQALVTHSLDHFVTSCILAIFGVLHLDAFYQNKTFVKEAARSRNLNAAGKED
jgi:hypothetical protein